MNRTLKSIISVLIVVTIIMSGITSFAAAVNKPFSVVLNSVNVKVNGKVAKVDNFSYAGKVFLQPQDVSSLLNAGYVYNLKSKTVNISSKKPVKPNALAKRKFASVKAATKKSLKMTANTVIVKIDGKVMKTESFIYDNSVFVSAKDLVPIMGKDFTLDTKNKTCFINEKKPTTPVLVPNTLEKTKGNVTVTIIGWGNAQTKEYKIDNGSWLKYTMPIVMKTNGTMYARGTNIAGIASDVASMKIDNILTLLSKVQIADLKKSVVKVISYNKNNNKLGTGSGFYISEDGNVVTNYHVIDLASYLEIEDIYGNKYNVIGVLDYSVEKDLAVLKIEGINSCPYLMIGDSNKLVYGEDVVAIGYPLGMPVNVTYGNIGSLNIDGVLSRIKCKDIQISTPISSGNSGGPLLNMYGEVIGINYANSGGDYIQNLNRTIPSIDLKPMLDSTKLKSLTEVIKEEYSKGDFEKFSKRVYYDYYTYTQGEFEFRLDYVNTFEAKDDDNKIYGILLQMPESYNTLQEAESKDRKKDIEDWIKKVFEEFKEQYPEKNIELQLAYIEYSKVLPNALDTSDYFFDKERGEWAIRKYKLAYYKEYGDYKFYYWN